MKYLNQKNKKTRKTFKNFEHLKLINKIIKVNNDFILPLKRNSSYYNSILPKKSTYVKIYKLCLFSNKHKTFNKYLNISRINYLKYARSNMIYGLKKLVY